MVYGDTWHNRQHMVLHPEETQSMTNEDYVQFVTTHIHQLYEMAMEHQERVVQRRLQHSSETPTEFEVGDHVLVCYPDRPPTKHTPKWRGPYTVVSKLNENRYQVQHCNTNSIIEVHITMCKPFTMHSSSGGSNQEEANDLREIAALDNSEAVIERILQHHYYGKGYGKTGPDKKKYDFEVKFINDEETKWLKYTEVADTEALDVYLQEHPDLHL